MSVEHMASRSCGARGGRSRARSLRAQGITAQALIAAIAVSGVALVTGPGRALARVRSVAAGVAGPEAAAAAARGGFPTRGGSCAVAGVGGARATETAGEAARAAARRAATTRRAAAARRAAITARAAAARHAAAITGATAGRRAAAAGRAGARRAARAGALPAVSVHAAVSLRPAVPVRAAVSAFRVPAADVRTCASVSDAARGVPTAVGRVPATATGGVSAVRRISAGRHVSAVISGHRRGADADGVPRTIPARSPREPVVDPQGDRVILLPTATTHAKGRSTPRTTISSSSRPATRSRTARSFR